MKVVVIEDEPLAGEKLCKFIERCDPSILSGGALRQTSTEDFIAAAAQATNISKVYVSRGQTRETIAEMTLSKKKIFQETAL